MNVPAVHVRMAVFVSMMSIDIGVTVCKVIQGQTVMKVIYQDW